MTDAAPAANLDEKLYERETPLLSDKDKVREAKDREDRVRLLAVLLALDGRDIEEALGYLEASRSIELDAIKEEFQKRGEFLDKRIRELEDSIKECKQNLDGVRQEQQSLRTERANVDLALQMLRVEKAALLLEFRVKRLEKEKEFFAEHEKNFEAKSERAEEAANTWKEREIEEAKRVHEALLDIWKNDEEELRRRAGALQEEKERIQSHLADVEKRVKNLRNIGITRTIAGFLVWVGYSVFAGVGGMVGKLLQGRQNDPKSADSLGNFIRGLSSFLGLPSEGQFQWMPLVIMIGLTMSVAVLVIGVTVLSDYLLNKFHKRWKASGKTGKRGVDRGARWQDVISALGPGSFRFGLPSREIRRGDYVQLIAAVPYLILAAVIVFIVSAVDARVVAAAAPGAPVPTPDALSTATTLTSASIGAIFVLLSTSACLLYATKIIEPRWNKLVAEAPEGLSFWKYVGLNWEFAVIIVAMLVGLLVLAFAQFGEVSNYRVWGLMAFFMCLASMGLAYGLIYRGVFRDYDFLVRRRQDCTVRIEEHILKPTLGDVFEATEPDQPRHRAHRYRMAATYLEGLEIGYELNRIAPDRPRDADDFLRAWLDDFGDDETSGSKASAKRYVKKLRKLIRRLLARRLPVNPQGAIPWDAAPEKVGEYQLLEEKVEVNSAKLRELESQIARLDQEKGMSQTRLSRLEAERERCLQQAATTAIDCTRKLRDRATEEHADSADFKTAFLAGKLWRDYLEGGPRRHKGKA